MEFCQNVAISRKKIGDKKATKSVILGTISSTFEFSAPRDNLYSTTTIWLQICFFGYKFFFDLVVAIIEVLSFSMLKIEL
jgi:hypothetical protein